MAVLYANNATTTLSASITNSATSLSVASGKGALFPAITGSDYFYITLTNTAGAMEIAKVTARTTDTFTITRGQDGTTGLAWAAGDKVDLRITKSMLDDLKGERMPAYGPSIGSGGRVMVNMSGNPAWSDANFTYDPIMGQFRATNLRANVGDSAPTWNFNNILHAGNYTSYSPTLTGTGASGTWGINVTGTAAGISSTSPTLAAAVESNSVYISSPGYTDGQITKPLIFDWYGNYWAIGNVRSGSTPSSGFGISYADNTPIYLFSTTGLTANGYLQAGNAAAYDNPGGWNANVVASGAYHARVRVKATSYNSSGDQETYLWVDNTVNPATGIYSTKSVFNFVGSITTVQVAGNTVLTAGNYTSYATPRSEYRNFGTIYVNPVAGSSASCTTAQLISHLTSLGFFNYSHSVGKCAWDYAGNNDVTDTGFGTLEMAGCVVETFWDGTNKHVRITRPTTGAGGYQCLVYNDQGAGYSPGWRQFITSENIGSQSVNYATSAGSATDSTKLPLSGGTLSGNLILSSGYIDLGSHLYQRADTQVLNSAGTAWVRIIARNNGSPYLENITYGGNTILHAGNFSGYALPLSGGTVTGTARFSVPNNSSYIQIDRTSTSYEAGINFQTAGTTYWWNYTPTGSTSTLNWYANGSIRMQLSNAGILFVNGNTVLHAGNYTSYVSGAQYFGTAATKAIAYNSNTISENITITAGNNGLSAGPVTVSTGYTVTVATGASWSVV